MEGFEAIADFFRVFFTENVSSSHSALITGSPEGDVPSPSVISPEEIETGTPPTPSHLNPTRLYRNRWRGSAVSRPRGEFLLQMSIQMVGPIRHPNVEGGEGENILEVQEEGSQRVLSKGNPKLPCPHPRP